MHISNEARLKLREYLEHYGEGFVRVARLTVGGACCAKLVLGVTLDDDIDELEDLSFAVEGLPVVVERTLYHTLKDISIAFDPEQGIVVSHAAQ